MPHPTPEQKRQQKRYQKRHQKIKQRHHQQRRERLVREQARAQCSLQAIEQAVQDRGLLTLVADEVRRKLIAQGKLLGKLFGIMCPPLILTLAPHIADE